jgi:CubicO group peptidase (beta-lactamase class C family)
MQLDIATLEAAIRNCMERYVIPGIGIAVVEGDTIVYENTFGVHRTPDHPTLRLSTPMQGASLSKPIMAYLAMKLVEQGTINLHMPLIKYWADPSIQGEFADTITAYHVLTHTTGFPNWRESEMLSADSPVGRTYGYSGEGFELLQHVIEHITAIPLHDYARTQLFDPLGMTNTSFAWGLDVDGKFVMDGENNPTSLDDPRIDRLMSSAAFTILTTATDYANLLIAMFNPRESHPSILNASVVSQMLTSQIQVGNHLSIYWGLGWGLQKFEDEYAFWHWGGAQNRYANYAIGFPATRKGVVIMTNSSRGFEVHEHIAQIVLDDYRPHPAFQWLLPIAEWNASG